jgi:hypothetical protein
MKLLLDENLPHDFRHELPGHQVFTAKYMRFDGLENGVLLSHAAAAGFDALLTKDANLQYQQNLVHLPLAVVVIHAPSNDIDDLRPLVPALLTALTALAPNAVTHVP